MDLMLDLGTMGTGMVSKSIIKINKGINGRV